MVQFVNDNTSIFSIIVKLFLCFSNQLKLKMAFIYCSKRTHNVDSGDVIHCTSYHLLIHDAQWNMRCLPAWIGQWNPVRQLYVVFKKVQIPNTPWNSHLILQPNYIPQMTVLIAFHWQAYLIFLICPSLWMVAKKSTRKWRMASWFEGNINFIPRTPSKTS